MVPPSVPSKPCPLLGYELEGQDHMVVATEFAWRRGEYGPLPVLAGNVAAPMYSGPVMLLKNAYVQIVAHDGDLYRTAFSVS